MSEHHDRPFPVAPALPADHPLARLFAGLVEHAFAARMGWSDPAVTDYLANMLGRFVHRDGLWALRDAGGRRLEEVAEMLVAAHFPGSLSFTDRRVVIHRHVGDYTLFWSGLYPESLGRLRNSQRRDHLIDYISQGKRSYRLAADAESPHEPTEARVLARLSEHFEECVVGLGMVRREWEDSIGGSQNGQISVMWA